MVNSKKKMKIKIFNSPFTIFSLLLSKKILNIDETKLIIKTSPFFYE